MATKRTHRLAFALLGAGASLVGCGCGFSDGDPWGTATAELTVAFDDGGRADESGLATSDDYRVDDLEVVLDFGEVTLGSASTSATFDPADPPEGYSLCHNGHCHSDSGELVDYDVIALELGGSTSSVAWAGSINAQAEVSPAAPTLALPVACTDCSLPQGTIGSVTVNVNGGSLRAQVTDRRTGDRARLDAPTAVDADLPSFSLTVPLRLRIDGRADPNVSLALTATVPVTVIDGVDWTDAAALGDALGRAFEEQSSLNVELHRSSF